MAVTYTENYNLGKQENHADKFDMSVITENMNKIDKALSGKVNAEEGEGLITDEEKKKLSNLENYDDTEIRTKTVVNQSTLGYEKRNFLKVAAKSRERNGISATVNEDGSITLNGTNTAGSAFMLFSNLQTGATPEGSQFSNNKKWIPTGRYIMSQGGVNGVTLQIRLAEESGVEGEYFSCGTSDQTIVVSDNHNYVWNRILISTGASFNNVTIYPMIRHEYDTDSSFTPYQASVKDQLAEILDRLKTLESAAGITLTSMEGTE